MEFLQELNSKPITLMIEVATASDEKIRVIVKDNDKPFTVYTDRYAQVDGRLKFYVRMPLSPPVAKISVFNEKNGNLEKGQDNTFKVIGFEEVPLKEN